jgi:hypothetical protein
MATLLVKDIPNELYLAFSKLAANKGLSVLEVTVKAIENYLQISEIEERSNQISERLNVSIDPAEISKIIKEERSKRP